MITELALVLVIAQFGPWDAGEKREVDRQGQEGKDRYRHPMVGAKDKVPATGLTPPPLRLDIDIPEHEVTAGVNKPATGLSANPLYLSALFYRHFLTKVDGPRCAHLPTCSRFANQAVAKHGALGILMGLERLIQDDSSSVLRKLPIFEGAYGPRLWDPVSNYVFWRDDFGAFPRPTDEEPLEDFADLKGKAEVSP